MLFRNQVLVTILAAVWVIAADGRFVRQKREFADEFANKMVESAMTAVQAVQDAIVPPDGEIVASSGEDDGNRKKRQAEIDELDPDMQEVQGIWRDMWQTMMEGGKKIVKKLAQSFDREAEADQQNEY